MKVKNVIKGYKTKFNIEEINVISSEKIIYSGSMNGWDMTDVDMISYKKQVENMDVVKSMMFNNRKLFLFV